MANSELDIEALREDIKRQMRLQRKIGRYGMLGGHVLMFVLFSILSLVFLGQAGRADALQNLPKTTSDLILTPFLLVWIGWATGLFFHVMAVLNEMGLLEKANKRMLVSRAVADQLLREVSTESGKPKRKRTADSATAEVRLTDEGELEPADEDDIPAEQVRRASQRR
jgi:hypothetical protein